MNWLARNAKKIIRITAGIAIILIGMGLGFVPGIPGFPLVFLGLGILAVDFVWAARLHAKMKATAGKVVDKVRGKQKPSSAVRGPNPSDAPRN
jgi:tellurite resistance protein TerC